MLLEEAIKQNPYDPQKGKIGAYIRYLRYNVDGLYNIPSSEVKKIYENMRGKHENISRRDAKDTR